MFEIQGKYTSAKIHTDYIEEEALQQVYKVLNHPAFEGSEIAIMPDVHAGAGCVIGFTQKFTNDSPVIANLVGVDINCGMLAYNLGNTEIDFESFDNAIRRGVPFGFNKRKDIHPLLKKRPKLVEAITRLAKKVNMPIETAINSVGSLGGGNHFVEVGEAPNGDKWIVIHTGSRNFGLQVCKYHQNKAKEYVRELHDGADAYGELAYLDRGQGAEEYFEDMEVAQEYAEVNRLCILDELIREIFYQNPANKELDWNHFREKFTTAVDTSYEYYPGQMINSNHNYIDFENQIIRKGATPAREGQKLIIPFNMRDGIALCTGKGNKDWNESAPHGAGRILSRGKAKKELTVEDFEEDMKDVFTTCVNANTLDESPRAYKDTQMILDAIKPTVEVDILLKPVFNFKG